MREESVEGLYGKSRGARGGRRAAGCRLADPREREVGKEHCDGRV